MTPVVDSMKSIALRAAANKTYYGVYAATDLSGYARCPRGSPTADDMDDISVGRPSPPASPECYARVRAADRDEDADADADDSSNCGGGGGGDAGCGGDSSGREDASSDYFEPLKKLGTVQIDKVSYGISDRKHYAAKRRRQAPSDAAGGVRFDGLCTRTTTIAGSGAMPVSAAADDAQPAAGVKSFSIADILSHEPSSAGVAGKPADDAAKIVRPWTEEYQPSAGPPPPPPCSSFALPPPPAHRQPVVGALFPHSLFIQHLQHQQQQQHHHHHHHQQQQQHHHHHHSHHTPPHHHRPKSADYETSTCTSGRSSTDGSECCTSPEIASCTQSNPSSAAAAAATRKQQASGGKNDNSSPLDALFQMTSKTFDQLHGDPSGADTSSSHLNLFNSRAQPKKKRKSRTAFTNHQIFELEKRFLYQKYLSPADRDEIASSLGLTNAQVITWFQNRRAKMKRDYEEQKKDRETLAALSEHKIFLETAQNMGILKKKPQPSVSSSPDHLQKTAFDE